MARRLGDDRDARLRHARLHPRPPLARHTRRQLELATELIEVAERAGDKERVVDGHEQRLDRCVELGDTRRQGRAGADGPARVRDCAALPGVAGDVYRALLALLRGEPEAEARILRARARRARRCTAGTPR